MPITLSTLASPVGGCTVALMPLFQRLEAHVLGAERLHGEDTRVPVLAKGKTSTGRIWVNVRDDKLFGGPAPSGAEFYHSRDRGGEHPGRIWQPTADCSRQMPMVAMASYTMPAATQARS